MSRIWKAAARIAAGARKISFLGEETERYQPGAALRSFDSKSLSGFWPTRLDVQVGHRQGVRLDERTAGLNDIAHQGAEHLIGRDGIFDGHLQ